MPTEISVYTHAQTHTYAHTYAHTHTHTLAGFLTRNTHNRLLKRAAETDMPSDVKKQHEARLTSLQRKLEACTPTHPPTHTHHTHNTCTYT